MDREQIESLHEKASGHYLQGDYVAALAAWDQLLGLSPNDERAREGVRLCRMMVQSEDEPHDAGTDLDAALTAFDAPETEEESPETANATTWPGREIGEDAPVLEPELDLEALDEMAGESPAGPADVTPEEGQDLEVELLDGIVDEPDASPASPESGLAADDPAAAELQKRIGELLDQARNEVAEGRNDEALGILARLFILDEGHAEAQALAEHVRSTMEGQAREIDARIEEGVQVLESGNAEEAQRIFQAVLDVAPYHQEAKHYLEKIEAKMDEAQATGAEDNALPLGDFEPGSTEGSSQDHGAVDLESGEGENVGVSGLPAADPVFADLLASEAEDIDDEDFGDEDEDDEPESSVKKPRRKTETSPVLLATAVVVMVGAGVYAWFFTDLLRDRSGSTGQPVGAATAEVGTGGAGTTDGAIGAEPTGSAEDRSTEELLAQAERLTRDPGEVQAAIDPARVRNILQRAEQHMNEEDYSAAVFAYNEALELDPGNELAHDGLIDAGRLFREHKQQLEELDRAIDSFEAGDYESALRTLYRLPDNLDPETVERVKLASWYNLGLTHLRAGETTEAIRYFDEALQIREDDPPSVEARDLAERFSNVVHDRTYYAQVDRLDFRGL